MPTTHRTFKTFRQPTVYLAVAAALVMGSLSPAHADNDDDASPADDGPSAVDAATSFDQVPREEAERFALLEDSYWKFVTAAEDVEGFAGAWVSWEPLTVHFATTAEPPAELLAIFDEPSLITHHDVEYDLVQLEAAQQELIELRAEGSIPPVDLDIDIRENELVVYSPDTATFSRVQALADVELPIRWEQAPLAAPTTSGGGSMGNGCTAGFMVRRSDNATVFGPLSAGHTGCRNPTTYAGLSTSVPSWQASGNRDSSVHRLSGGTNQNRITISVSPYYQTITGRLAWSSGLVGQSICKQGRATGYGCNTVNSVNYSPSYIPNSSRFLYMNSGSGTLCNNGDSGGPWFQFSNAVGLTSGKVASGSNAGNCIVASITYQIPSGWILTT